METLLPESIQTILLGIFAVAVFVVWVARRLPQVEWLEPFRLSSFQPTLAQKARHRRFGTIKAGVEIILAGIVVPPLYVLSKVFMFDEPTSIGLLVSGMIALACVAAGTFVLIRSKSL